MVDKVDVKNHQVLLVDDERSINQLISSYLLQQGFSVFCAESGEEAIGILQKNNVDIVLTDIKMPGINGVDLLKWIKNFNHMLPVIMTTGYPTIDSAIEALKLGAYDYLTKPFHLEEIFEKMCRALQTKHLEEDNVLFSKLVSLHEVTKVLSSTHNLEELHKRFLDYSIRMSKSTGGALILYNGTAELVIALQTPFSFNPNFWNQMLFYVASEWVARHGEPLALEQHNENRPENIPPLPEYIQSYIAFPLRTFKQCLGVLNLVRVDNPQPFSNVDLEIINVLTSQASISIENARLYENLQDNYLKTISGFALAVEAKDKYTHGHSENVMKYTVILAQYLGFSGKELEQIKYAGLLHDIGKIGIDEAILNKPGKLTISEFEQIKKHPELGCHIIANVPFFDSLVPLIRHHHEFFNGEGYPDRISGDQIPYGARILSVADAFEAMTSNRPYRRALPYKIAFDILYKERSKQFDPDIVTAFIQVMKMWNT